MTHICVGKLTIIGSDNGLSRGRRQAIIRTSAGILLIGPLGTTFSEILIVFNSFSFKKVRFKLSSGQWRPCCLGLNVINTKSIQREHETQFVFMRSMSDYTDRISNVTCHKRQYNSGCCEFSAMIMTCRCKVLMKNKV